MLDPSQARPELRAEIERIQRDSHNRRSDALYADCVLALQRAAALHDDAGFVLLAKPFALIVDQRGHPDEGVGLLFEALERARGARWFDEQAELLVLIGRVDYARAEYLAALELWTEALEVAQRAGDLVSWGWAKLGIGQICDALGSPALAVAVFDELRLAVEAATEPQGRTRRLDKLRLYTHLNLGVNHWRMQQVDAAWTHYQRGLDLARALDIRDEQGEALMRMAEVAHARGRADEALGLLDRAGAIGEACAFHWLLAHVSHLRARLLAERGDHGAALAEIEQALAHARRAGSPHVEARVLQAQSALAEAAGQAALALAALQRAVALNGQIDQHSKSRTLQDIEDLAGIRVSPDRKLLVLSSHPAFDGGDWPRAAQLLCDEGRAALNVDRVVLWAADASGLHPRQASGGAVPAQAIPPAMAPELIERLMAGESVLAHNARHHQDTWPLQGPYLGPHDVQALLAYPVLVGGETVGVFFFEQIGRRHHWSRDAAVLANQLVTIAGRCLAQITRRSDQERIRSLNEELRQANLDLERRIEDRTGELRATLQALEQSRAEAERNARVKGEFLAHMSHEIRTPLNGVLGLAQTGLWQGQQTPEQSRETLAAILESGQLLLGIINDILDFSKLDAGMVRIEAVPVDLPHVAQHSADIVADRARQKGIALVVDLAPGLTRWCRGDPLRLGQILMNLLSNAVKFTEAGQVTLRVRAAGGRLHLAVQDTGIGIAPDQLAQIFQAFAQADSSTTREFGGTGLGLTITRRLVELMGGEIAVESAPGLGSLFTVTLPHEPLDEALQGPGVAGPPLAATALAGCAVLVAEDNEVNQMVVQRLLAMAGVQVTLVGNGREAVDAVRAAPAAFDAVLMDIQMPEMDGYEAARRLRGLAPGLPVIGLTAHALAEDRALCEAAGMADHVAKPIVAERLLAALLQHARRRSPA
ncbi:MAG: ATP-binding protein [Burkholderiaceae bacterium]